MTQSQSRQGIPTKLTLEQFKEFVLPHLHMGSRDPQPKLSLHAIFNYILKLLYLGCQWKELPIEKNKRGNQKFTTPESMEHFGVMKFMGASMPFSRLL